MLLKKKFEVFPPVKGCRGRIKNTSKSYESSRLKRSKISKTTTFLRCWRWLSSHCIGWRADGEREWEEEEEHVFNPSVRPYMFSIWQPKSCGRCWCCRKLTPKYTPPMLLWVLCSFPAGFSVHDETLNLWSQFLSDVIQGAPTVARWIIWKLWLICRKLKCAKMLFFFFLHMQKIEEPMGWEHGFFI